MANLKLKVADEGLMVKFTPHHDTEQKCIAYGREFGKRMTEEALQTASESLALK